jgi:class 3 adenylate cyclase/tetratricopeptide (TPR) repeat protein
VICSNCGTENALGAKFCSECATRLAVACPSCGTANGPTAKFCSECATPLVAGVVPASPASAPGAGDLDSAGRPSPGTTPAVAERRLVSVLFADLVGFTSYAEGRDAEEVRETLSAYFDLAREIIERYGGTVEKFIGDAVMAVWGAPVAREDDAERAVRAALDLVAAVPALGPTIQARAGVLTAEAAVTLGATGEGMVAGDLVNTAARLQSVAPVGTVLVGEPTQRAAGAAIAFEEAGEQLLKGKASPVPAWRALRVIAQRGGHGRSDMPEPPFVGRDEEFRLLKDALAAVGRDRRARLVSISGPGGIGKSRLAWELEKYIDGILENVYWHRGRSPAYGEGITFWALGEMVRRRAGLAESDDEATTRRRIAETVAEYIPAVDDQRWVEPALLTLLGLEPPPPGGRDMLFAAWRIFFERIAERGPTILLFEDLQWADSGLLDFIDRLLEWSKGVPILVVTLARPELFERRADWGSGTRHFTSLALEPLPDTAMRDLLAGFVPGLPASAVAAILSRADGVPLYAVETVRTLVAEGRLERVGDRYRPIGDLDTLAIPETLRSLIASRLDALKPAERAIVQDASVLGQVFTLAGLSAVNGASADELEPRTRALVRRELLEVESDPRSPERGQYRFVQSLIREVAYGTLARRDRRARHLAAARFIESIGDEELAGVQAGHYLAAFEASTPGEEADAVAAQARVALRGAAERAAALGAHDQAVAFAQQALHVTSDPRDQAELLLLSAQSADFAGHYEQSESLARQARERLEASGDAAGAGRAAAQLGLTLIDAGRVGEAVPVLESGLAAMPADLVEEVRASLLTNLSRALFRNDQPVPAIEVADRALTIAERLDLEELIAEAFNNKAAALGYIGRNRESVALMEAAVRTAQQGGFLAAELRARNNLASTIGGDDVKRALTEIVASLELAERSGNRMITTWQVGTLALYRYQAAVAWDDARARLEASIDDRSEPADRHRAMSFVALYQIARGEPVDALLKQLETLSGGLADPVVQSVMEWLHGELAFSVGDHARAYDAYLRGAAESTTLNAYLMAAASRAAAWQGDPVRLRVTLDRLDANPDVTLYVKAGRLEGHACLSALDGDVPAAVGGFIAALRSFGQVGARFDQAMCAMTFVRAVGPGVPEALAAAEEARAIFESVGARPYLERLVAELARPSTPPARSGSTPSARVEA